MSLVYKTDYRKAILHGGHKVVVLYMQTHSCIPKPCWVEARVLGNCSWSKPLVSWVWSFIADTITVLRTGYQCLQCSHLGLTQVPYLWRWLSREHTYRRMCEYIHFRT